MICDFADLWTLPKYDGFKTHVNVTDGLVFFVEERIKVGKEEAGANDFNQAYNKSQANQENIATK